MFFLFIHHRVVRLGYSGELAQQVPRKQPRLNLHDTPVTRAVAKQRVRDFLSEAALEVEIKRLRPSGRARRCPRRK